MHDSPSSYRAKRSFLSSFPGSGQGSRLCLPNEGHAPGSWSFQDYCVPRPEPGNEDKTRTKNHPNSSYFVLFVFFVVKLTPFFSFPIKCGGIDVEDCGGLFEGLCGFEDSLDVGVFDLIERERAADMNFGGRSNRFA